MFKKIKRITAVLISLAAVVQISAVNVINADEDPVYSTDFENEEACWYAFGDTNVIELSDDYSNSGEFSLKASNRTNIWMGPAIELTDYFDYGPSFTVSFMAFQAESEASVSIGATVKVYTENGSADGDYLNVASQAVLPGEWTQVKGTVTLPNNATRAELYIETPGNGNQNYANMDFYIDDFTLYSGTVEPAAAAVTLKDDVTDGDAVLEETEETQQQDENLKDGKKNKKKANAVIPIMITATLLLVGVGIAAYILISKKSADSGDDSDIDQLTRVYVKEKYEERIRDFQSAPEKLNEKYFSVCEIINMQKITADFGQAHGDEALMICGYLLKKAADKHGKVYRVSNDRFVIISDKNLKNEIRQEIDNQKKENKNYDIQIAFGYSYFDKKNDGIPNAKVILDRAETMMLSDKNKITAVQSENEAQSADNEDILKTLETVQTIDTNNK